MEIDFSKFIIKDIEGNDTAVDISRPLGNAVYFGATDISQADLGREIYKRGAVDLTREQAEFVRGFIKTMSWPVRVAYDELIK
jgi:hypothetical protein